MYGAPGVMSRKASEICELQPCEYDIRIFFQPQSSVQSSALHLLAEFLLTLGAHIALFQQLSHQPIYFPTMFSTLNLNPRNHPSITCPLICFAGYDGILDGAALI